MADLFSIEELIEVTGGHAENINVDAISSISIDSRTISEGALYVAIKGDRFDGHGFVHKAVVNGAAATLVSEEKARELAGLPLIIVDDPLAGLVKIAKAARARSKAKIVAITGSAGKTTTKSMVAEILSRVGGTHASIKSYNNHWGVPLMLASMPESAKFGVFEIGMNHAGEIGPLVEMARPHVALVTNVGSAHVGNFDGFEDIAKAKAEIILGIEPGGVAIVNADHSFMDVFNHAIKKHGNVELQTFGFSSAADVGIYDYSPTQVGARAQARFDNVGVNLELNVPGEHMVSNAVGALCVAHALDVGFDAGVEGLAVFESTAGRGELINFGPREKQLLLLDESYNANPASMAAVLSVFKGMMALDGSKILVLGDMLELGERSKHLHLALVPAIIQSGAQKVVLVGERMGELKAPLAGHMDVEWAAKVDDITDSVAISLDYGDTIMVKGSLGIALSKIIEAIRKRFD